MGRALGGDVEHRLHLVVIEAGEQPAVAQPDEQVSQARDPRQMDRAATRCYIGVTLSGLVGAVLAGRLPESTARWGVWVAFAATAISRRRSA